MRIRNWHAVAKRPEGIKVEFIGSSGPQCTVVPEEERYSFIPSSPPQERTLVPIE